MKLHTEDEDLVRSRIEHAAEDERRRRRGFGWALLSFLGSLLVGLLLCAWGLHSTDPVLGPAIFTTGVVFTNVGVLVTLLVCYRRVGE